MTGEQPPTKMPLSARSHQRINSHDLLLGSNDAEKISSKSPQISPTSLKSVIVIAF